MKAEGKLKTDFIEVIPYILYLSDSKIENNSKVVGRSIAIHITPFFAFGVIIPKMFYKEKEKRD